MATRNANVVRFEGPCTSCAHKAICVPYVELHNHLFSHAKFRKEPICSAIDVGLDAVVERYVASLRALRAQGLISDLSLGNALSALVDLCITGIYTNGLINDKGEFSQQALRCGRDYVLFPYTWMCPLCVTAGKPRVESYLPMSRRESKNGVVRDYPQVEWLAKPGGRAIGDQGIRVVKALLRATLKASGTNARLRDGGGARGEFDLTVATDSVLAFVEVKAKPLIAYPLVATMSSPFSEGSVQHEWLEASMSNVAELVLLLAATNHSLPLSRPTSENVGSWPLQDLAHAVSDPNIVASIISNWTQHAEAYVQWTSEPDRLRWHRFGCGNFPSSEDGLSIEKRVANTKELPGLDRTDDIKKGAAQVLKYSRLKFQCKRRALRAVLLGNTHALTHHKDYVSPLLHLKVVEDGGDPSRSEWIFDAMVGLTQNHFNVADLATIFAFERLLDEPLTSDRDHAAAGMP